MQELKNEGVWSNVLELRRLVRGIFVIHADYPLLTFSHLSGLGISLSAKLRPTDIGFDGAGCVPQLN